MKVFPQDGQSRRMFVALAATIALILSAMAYVLYLGDEIVRQHVPQANAAARIEASTVTAHLWFEEALFGDERESVDDVWQLFDEADRCCQALLDGGDTKVGAVRPVSTPDLRRDVEKLDEMLTELRAFTERRWKAKSAAKVGSDMDERYDDLFRKVIRQANNVGKDVQASVESSTDWFKRLQAIAIGSSILMACLLAVVFHRYESSRLQAAKQREELVTELETKNAELERFAYAVSHDLRSPLVTIKGYMGVVKEDLSDRATEQTIRDMERVENAANKMQILLDEVLELSRIGRVANPSEDVPLGEISHDVEELLAGSLSEANATLTIASPLPTLYGDRIRLREVLQNLVENSIKFSADNRAPLIEIGAQSGDNEGEVVCFVRDNGTGIEPQYREKIFGLFDTLGSEAKGHGVGLALAKRIVEVHGGRIWMESEGLDRGATFYFTLPTRAKPVEQTS